MSLVDEITRALIENDGVPDPFIPFNYNSNGLEASHVVSTGASFLFGFFAYNNNAATRYLLIFDSDKVPGNGAVPTVPAFPIATASNAGWGWLNPRRMDRGIVLVNSSTPTVLTLSGADLLLDVQYV